MIIGSSSCRCEAVIEIATDGSCSTVTRHGGWAFTIQEDPHFAADVFYGCETDTTISRMELLACIKALEWLLTTYEQPVEVRLVTDSSYVRNCFKDRWWKKWERNGWKNSGGDTVVNKDLWVRLIELNKAFKIHWVHVKGHQGRHAGNDTADRWAVYARKEQANGRA